MAEEPQIEEVKPEEILEVKDEPVVEEPQIEEVKPEENLEVKEETIEEDLNFFEDEEEFEDDDDLDEFDDYDFEPKDDDELDVKIEENIPLSVEIDIKAIEEKLAALGKQSEPISSVQDPYETKEMEIVGSSYVLEETSIALPNLEENLTSADSQPVEIKEPTLIQLPNETYDPEFAPKNEPIEASFLATADVSEELIEEQQEAPSVEVNDTPIVQDAEYQEVVSIQENASFTTLDSTEIQTETHSILLDETHSEYKTVSSPKPILPVQVHSTVNHNKEAQDWTAPLMPLDDNPYYESRRMNFKWKPVILSIVTLCLVLGLFISVFIIIKAFK